MDGLILKEFIDEDNTNLFLLKKLTLARDHFWNYIFHIKYLFNNFQIKTLNSVCEKCGSILKNNENTCNNCSADLIENIDIRNFTPIGSPGKGRKPCGSCSSYVAARTKICKYCGFNFETKKISTLTKPNLQLNKNKKRKKSVLVKIEHINDVSILIENDKTFNNIHIFSNYLNSYADLDNTLPYFNESSKIAFRCVLETKEELIINNINLVKSIANKIFKGKFRKLYHLKFDDLFQNGTIGLIKAVNKYDINRKYKNNKFEEKQISFSTYATYWITREILKSIITSDKYIRLPDHIINKYRNFMNFYNDFCKNQERQPDLDDITTGFSVSKKNAEGFMFAFANANNNVIDVDVIVQDHRNAESDEKFNIIEKAKRQLFSAGIYYMPETDKDLINIIKSLKFKTLNSDNGVIDYKDIFLDLFGFYGHDYTIEQVANKYCVSKVTVMRIRDENVEKIKRKLELNS